MKLSRSRPSPRQGAYAAGDDAGLTVALPVLSALVRALTLPVLLPAAAAVPVAAVPVRVTLAVLGLPGLAALLTFAEVPGTGFAGPLTDACGLVSPLGLWARNGIIA